MTQTSFSALSAIISEERMSTYIRWAKDDEVRAEELYRINLLLSERWYIILHMIEVTLRNRIDDLLCKTYDVDWFDDKTIVTNPRQQYKIRDVKEYIIKRNKPFTRGHIIAELNFGFWCSFFNTEYDATLWRSTLYRVAQSTNSAYLPRKKIAYRIQNIRLLRNRIAHYEPILRYNLPQLYSEAVEMLSWLSPEAAQWTQNVSSFITTHQAHPYELQQ